MAKPPVPRAPASAPAFTGWHWLLIAVALGVAIALRLSELGTWSFWIDEAHSFRDATMPLHGEDGFLRQSRALYPLTFLGLRWLLDAGWVDGGEAALRLPFALAGIATVPLLAWCGRELVGARAAVLSAWFCALHPWHLFWSQNARGYVFAVLFSVVAVHRAQRWSASGAQRDLFAMAFAIGIGTLFHSSTALLAAGLFVFLLVRPIRVWNRRVVAWVAVGTVAMLLAAPWLVAESPFQPFLQTKDNASLAHFAETTAWYFRPLSLLAAGAALWLVGERLGRTNGLLLGCFCIVPFLLLSAIGVSIVKVTARYAICTLPVVLWLSAFACTTLADALAGRGAPRLALRLGGLVLPLAIGADFAAQTWSYFEVEHGGRAQWRQACGKARELAGDAVLRVVTVNDPTVKYYLRPELWRDRDAADPRVQVYALTPWGVKGLDREGHPILDHSGKPLHEPGGVAHLAWHRASARRDKALLAVLVTLPELHEMDADGSLWRTLQADFDLVQHLPCSVGPKDESIYVFVPRGP